MKLGNKIVLYLVFRKIAPEETTRAFRSKRKANKYFLKELDNDANLVYGKLEFAEVDRKGNVWY